MKKISKLVSIFCLVAILLSTVALTLVSAAEYVIVKPVEPSKWEEPNFSTDHAYSFAFVGDTQFITIGDALLGTEKLKYQFKYIADTAEERKLQHVFHLGDITDWGYRNDSNLAGMHYDVPKLDEWRVARDAIGQLNGVVSYSLCRGNHDDYIMDDVFNSKAYTSQFEGCGGFYVDLVAKQGGREKKNPDNCIYWSAVTGCHDESIVNSWKTMEICGTKYLFITYDYNPSAGVVNWLDEILGKYPDHRAIITTHSYLLESGKRMNPEDDTGNTNSYRGLTSEVLWNRVFKKHSNVFMIVSGHTGNEYVNYSYARGDNGNKVLQVLVDPQCYETREKDANGTLESGKQDIGLVLYMNFSEDGNRITFNNYSTLLGKFLKNQNFTINFNGENDTDGYIDMAAFAEGDQATPTIADKTVVELDGVVNDGEYGYSRTIAKEKVGNGTLIGDLTEHFAYDDTYLYYAFQITSTNAALKTINLHYGSSLYNRDQLNLGDHSLMGTYKFSNNTFYVSTNNIASTSIAEDNDFTCKAKFDKETKIATYELRIRRAYLADNGSPDNLLSYTLDIGAVKYRYDLSDEAKNTLVELGVTETLDWTYNYAYFGERPEATEVPVEAPEEPETEEPEAEAPVATEAPTEQTTEPPKTNGCKSSLAIVSIAFIPVLAGSALFARKRKDD